MPSKDELEHTPAEGNLLDVAADMEELVAAIKHNLRLKSRPCQLCTKKKRVSPYDVQSARTKHRSDCLCANAATHSQRDKKVKPLVDTTDDPYEMLQMLIREGSLIKEAVKRLQLNGETSKTTAKEKIDFYEHECSICDLPTAELAPPLEL